MRRQPTPGLSRVLAHGTGQKLFKRLSGLGKKQLWVEGALNPCTRLRKAGEQVAPAMGSQSRIHPIRILYRNYGPLASQPLQLCPQMQRD